MTRGVEKVSGFRGLCWRFWRGATALVMTLLLVGRLGLVDLPATIPLAPDKLLAMGGFRFVAAAEAPVWDVLERHSQLRLLEDGRPLGPFGAGQSEIARLGRGRFDAGRGVVAFSSSDGTDPRSNGRKYQIECRWQPPGWLFWLGFLAFVSAHGASFHGWTLRLRQANPIGLALVAAALTAAHRIGFWYLHGQQTWSGTVIKGVPFSDARYWHLLATELATGQRWSAAWTVWNGRRPGYYLLMGAIHALFGPSIEVVRAVHVTIACVSAVLIADAARRLVGAGLAIPVLLVHVARLSDAWLGLSSHTEPLGYFLTNLSLWLLIVAGQRLKLREEGAGGVLLLGGVFLGLANLVRPLTLLAAGLVPPALSLLASPGPDPKRRWLRIGGCSLLFLLGVALPIAPWSARQKLVHDVWTISENSAESTFAATSPDYGEWRPAVSALAPTSKIAERHRYYTDRTKQNLKEHFWWYVRHASWNAFIVAWRVGPQLWLVLVCCLLAGVEAAGDPAANRRTRLRVPLTAALLAGALCCLPEELLWLVWPAAAILAALRRHPALLLGTTLAATAATLGALAVTYSRCTYSLEWVGALLTAWLIREVVSAAGRPAAAPVEPTERPEGWGVLPWPARIAVGAIALVLLCGWTRLVVSNLSNRSDPPRVLVEGTEADEWIARLLATPSGQPFRPLAHLLRVRRSRLRTDCSIPLLPGETVQNMEPELAPRPYPHTLLQCSPDLPEGYPVFPGELVGPGPDRDVMMIGVAVARNDVGSTLELAAVAYGDAGARTAELQQPSPELASAHVAWIAKKLGGPGRRQQ
ncbi:MAG: hypothetical protein HY303_00080 [Candidatus Wallbacteria bacterium]|nr:hypothetical protein [Candidatus Wallbacteria bacterium]